MTIQESPPYSLGNMIDWKLAGVGHVGAEEFAPYSLGNTIDWKPYPSGRLSYRDFSSLLAREHDRLETPLWESEMDR